MQHSFISIDVTRVDARVTPDGAAVEYAEAPPERQTDREPEQICEVCFVPLDVHSIKTLCPGPQVPDDASSLLG